MTEDDMIEMIRDIRADNNGLWMDLLQIALESEPYDTKLVLAKININDRKISELLGKLAQ